MTRITSRTNNRIKQVLLLRSHKGRRETGLFIAEGAREIGRAVAAGLVLRQFYSCPSIPGSQIVETARSASTSIPPQFFEVTEPVMEKIAYRKKPQGGLAVFEQPQWSLDQFAQKPPPDLWLVFVGATKPGNVGAMARTLQAAGATGLLLADTIVDALNPNAIRASTGAVFTLPIIAAASKTLIAFLRNRAVGVVAADPNASARYTAIDLTEPTALVIGGENKGLSPAWRQAARTSLVAIPMAPAGIDSLNAAATAAILVYEAVRQRSLANPLPTGMLNT